MNGKERLTRIFQGKEVDRPALKLWGLKIGQKMLHPSYQPVYDLALEISDIMQYVSSPFNIFLGSDNEDIVTIEDKPLPDSYWVDRYRYIQLPDRKLRSIHRYSTIGEPGYEIEHLVKEPDDLRALLHLKYNPFPIDISSYQEALGKVGDRGIVVFKLDHAAYAVSRIMGSECFALMCMDERELIKEAVDIYAARIRKQAEAVMNAGIKPVFGWDGPELCIPPLTRMIEFEEFVYDVDKPLCDFIHNGGGYVWVHCHGRVGKLLTRFMDMGIDVLNPIEPPPQGDISLKEAVETVGNGMGLEGNIEISALMLSKKTRDVEELVSHAVLEGRNSGRFILCPSTGYMECVNPSQEYIANLLTYLNYGLECLIK